jgi:hypothetical protein
VDVVVGGIGLSAEYKGQVIKEGMREFFILSPIIISAIAKMEGPQTHHHILSIFIIESKVLTEQKYKKILWQIKFLFPSRL